MLVGFVCFGLIASGVYILNDLADIEADRRHSSKRHRPFASGALRPFPGLAVAVALLVGSVSLAVLALPIRFVLVMSLYVVTAGGYTLWLKRFAIIDVALLASFYVMRVIAGAAATSISVSFWLLAFSLFLFFSIAVAKRFTELVELPIDAEDLLPRRGYRREDVPFLQALGIASGFCAVLVLALYVNSPESQALYRHPQALWMLVPILLLWVCRLWLLAHRRALHEDPLIYALTDGASLGLGAISLAILALAH